MTRPGPRWCRLALFVPLALASTASSRAAEEPLVPFHQGRLWGYADSDGKLVLPALYEEAERFEGGLARVARDGRWGAIDAAGREVVPLVYESLQGFSEDLAGACRATSEPTGVTEGVGRFERPVTRRRCGFVDRAGREVVPLRYDGVNPFREGVAQVRVARECPCLVAAQWGLIDREGHEIVPPAFCFVSPPSEGLVKVVFREEDLEVRRFGFIDLSGRVAIGQLRYEGSHEAWSEGVIGVRSGGRFGFLDHAGREVVPLRFDSAYPFSQGLAAVRIGERWGFLDHAGELAIAAEFDEVESFQEGLAWARRGMRAGFVDRAGRVVVPFEFDGWIDRQARPWWSEGLRGAKAIDGFWGFHDRTGRWAIPPVYDFVQPCGEGLCAVEKDGLWGFVDLEGRVVVPHRYRQVHAVFRDGLAFVSRRAPDGIGWLKGWIDRGGREYFAAK